MANVIHYLEPDDAPACGCSEVLVSWTYASGRATCPDCIRVLEARRGADWLKVVVADLSAARAGTGAK